MKNKKHRKWFYVSGVIIIVLLCISMLSVKTKITYKETSKEPITTTFNIPDQYLSIFSRLAYVMKVGKWDDLTDYQQDYEAQLERMKTKKMISVKSYNTLRQDWAIHNIFSDPNYSFEAISFYNKRENIMSIAYRGTEMGNNLDYGADLFQIFMGKNTVTANLAKEAFEDTYSELLEKKKRNIRFVITGHSLGGALAQEVADLYFSQQSSYTQISDLKVVGFNSPGMKNKEINPKETGMSDHFKYYISSMDFKGPKLDPISMFHFNTLYQLDLGNVYILPYLAKDSIQTIPVFAKRNGTTIEDLRAKRNLVPFLMNTKELSEIHSISKIVKTMENVVQN